MAGRSGLTPVLTSAVAMFPANLARIVDYEQLREPAACTIDATLNRPHRRLTDRCRLVVGEARRADEKQGLALNERQIRERVGELLELQATMLLGRRFQAVEVAAVGVFDLAASRAKFRPKKVTEDGAEPRLHVRSPLERIYAGYGAHERPLHEVIRRSTLPLSDIANARKLGTAASMTSRSAG